VYDVSTNLHHAYKLVCSSDDNADSRQLFTHKKRQHGGKSCLSLAQTLLIRDKGPEVAHLQALLDQKLVELRHEEQSLREGMEQWVALTDLNDHIKTHFPNLKEPIDMASPGASNELDASMLVMQQDIYLVQVQARMKGNYKRICEIFEDAQEIVDQMKMGSKNNDKYAEIKGILEGLAKPRADWEMTIKRLASIIRQLG
jgi:hypothetical protein